MTYPAEVDTIGFINLNPLARNILTMPEPHSYPPDLYHFLN